MGESLVLVQPDLKLYLPLALSILSYMLSHTMVPDITINNYHDALYNGREIKIVVEDQLTSFPS
ncbi:hypothetical protein [Ligilactobacillus equi]